VTPAGLRAWSERRASLRELLLKQWPRTSVDTFSLQAILDFQICPFRALAWIGSALGVIALFLSLSGL